MGDTDTTDDVITARRAFIRRLSAHEDVRQVDFTRDGFSMVVVELEPDAEFRDQWRQTATRLGYTVEQVEADAFRLDWAENTWLLRLAETGDSADRSTWGTKVRRTVARLVTKLRARLPGRSKR